MFNIRSNICRQSLSQTYILQCYRPKNESRLPKFHASFIQSNFVAFIGVDYNRWLRNYIKTIRLIIFVRGGGVQSKVLNVRSRGKGYQNQTSADKRGGEGSKFWSFYNNVII